MVYPACRTWRTHATWIASYSAWVIAKLWRIISCVGSLSKKSTYRTHWALKVKLRRHMPECCVSCGKVSCLSLFPLVSNKPFHASKSNSRTWSSKILKNSSIFCLIVFMKIWIVSKRSLSWPWLSTMVRMMFKPVKNPGKTILSDVSQSSSTWCTVSSRAPSSVPRLTAITSQSPSSLSWISVSQYQKYNLWAGPLFGYRMM